MKALVLAGGYGKRLRPLVKDTPKVMLPIAGRPLLEHLILLCREYEIKDIILSVHFRADVIRRHFGDGRGLGVRIVYIEEKEPRGSGGALDECRDLLTERFVVLNGDVMNRVNIHNLAQFHHAKGGIGTLVAHPTDHPYDSDIIEIDQRKRMRRIFRPKKGEKFENIANAGMFVLEPKILAYVEHRGQQSLEKNVIPRALDAGEAFYVYETDEYLKDIGTPERYREVKREFARMSSRTTSREQYSAVILASEQSERDQNRR